MTERDEALERAWGIEKLLEKLLPPLIAASPNRTELEAALKSLALLEPDEQAFPEEGIAAELADDLLQRLQSL